MKKKQLKAHDHNMNGLNLLIDGSGGFWIFYYARGDAYFQNGDYDLAIADFTAVLETRWYYSDAILMRAPKRITLSMN